MSASDNTQLEEEWREVAGSDGKYEVSNFGRVRGWADCHGGRRATPLYKKYRLKRGYLSCLLYIQGQQKNHFAHRLVLAAFVGQSDLHVNHKNGIRSDNRLENLEYITPKDNVRYSRDVLGMAFGQSGEKHHHAKLTLEQVEQIRVLANEGVTDTELAARFSVNRRHIGRIRRGQRWASQGARKTLGELKVIEGEKLIKSLEKRKAEMAAEAQPAANGKVAV